MLFKTIRKTKKSLSLFLVANLMTQLLLPLSSYSNSYKVSSGDGSPIAASASNMVNGYTGDFNYSVPLLTLPGPNGESVPVSVGYHAGIGTNQKASWVGLGWDYNPGEISRQVVEAPDDYNGKGVHESEYNRNAPTPYPLYYKTTAKFGALYNNNINTTPSVPGSGSYFKSGDVKTVNYNLSTTERCNLISTLVTGGCSGNGASRFDQSDPSSRFKRVGVPHKTLAYDNYSVSGGISGSIKPYYLGKINIYTQNSVTKSGLPVVNRKAQFYFENSTINTINETNRTSSTYVNQTTNQIHSGTRVRYFTNEEINDHVNLYNSSTNSGYLNFKATNTTETRRPTADHQPNLVGAFQITDPSGTTYHYSLPVYSSKDVSVNWGPAHLYTNYLYEKYASSWKLTAVTGPDYQDANGNYTADEGDTGYWISYNYSLWTTDYSWSSQRYGYKTDASIATKFSSFLAGSATGNKYSRTNSIANGHVQVYALNYIKTATHTAFFVKSIRKDEQSCDNIYSAIVTVKPVASLKLDRVILMRNEDSNLLINTTALGGSDLDNRFDYTSCANAQSDVNFVNVTRYKTNKAQIDQVALKTVELISDYSLAKKYTGNINNTFSASQNPYIGEAAYNALSGNGILYRNLISFTASSDLANSGKLTLKKINVYDLNAEKITPSIDFGYDESNPLKNPDFNQDKTDLWGYYKKDYINSHYVSFISREDVDAWSLKEINTSLGGKINIQYESDMYHREGFSDDPLFFPVVQGNFYSYTNGNSLTGCPDSKCPITATTPHVIFPVSSIDSQDGVYFEDADVYPYFGFLGASPVPDNKLYLIYSKIDVCNNQSSSSEPSTKHLIRYGCRMIASTAPYPTTLAYPNPTGPYPMNNVTNEMAVVNGCTGIQTFSTTITDEYGVAHVAFFSSFLYGGGIRVKQIDITEPFKNETYSQVFTYGEGYCPVVPKPMCFSTGNGPSNHDVIFNNKTQIYAPINSMVGYNSCTQKIVKQTGESLGSVVQSYSNGTINGLLSLNSSSAKGYTNNSKPVHVSGPNTFYDGDQLTIDYSLTFSTSSNNISASLLGKLMATDIVSANGSNVKNTVYSYRPSNIFEQYTYNADETDLGSFPYHQTPPTGIYAGTTSYFKKDYKDTYNYLYSLNYTNSCFLSATSTTQDGITITETITSRDPYTTAPTRVTVSDPTKGTYDSYTTPAYFNTASYGAFDLKTRNETNRNQPSLTESSQTVKNGKYVMSQSKVFYTNTYPTREYSSSLNKYVTVNYTRPWYHLNETYVRLLDDDEDVAVTPPATDWRKTSTATLYDAQHNRIEEMGLNNRKTASKWGYQNRYKLADIANANYNSFTFTSFEDLIGVGSPAVNHFGGEVTNGSLRSGVTVSYSSTFLTPTRVIKPHTGSYYCNVAPGFQGPAFNTENFEIGRTYLAKVWVHRGSPAVASLNIQLTGTTGAGHTALSVNKTVSRSNADNVTVGDWVLMSTEIEVPENFNLTDPHSLSVYLLNTGGSGTAYFDDLSVHPKDAVITGNVYQEKTGLLIAQLDNENFATLYNYDNAGRMVSAYKEYSGGIKKVTETNYHFAKP